jgi:hypothetical protein
MAGLNPGGISDRAKAEGKKLVCTADGQTLVIEAWGATTV